MLNDKSLVSENTCKIPLGQFDLRNEFHFSDVHGAMNGSGSRAK